MILDIELTDEEMCNLDSGGFYVVILHDGVKIIVTKDYITKKNGGIKP